MRRAAPWSSLRQQGLDCPIVGGAGTGTFQIELASGVYNEIQAGSYVFMDADYARNLDEAGAPIGTFRHSLFVLATVMSVPNRSIAVVDAGHKAVAVDSGLPMIWQRPDIRYVGASDEHGKLEVGIETRRRSWARSCGWCRAIAIRRWTATTGMSACGTGGWSASGRSRRAAGCIDRSRQLRHRVALNRSSPQDLRLAGQVDRDGGVVNDDARVIGSGFIPFVRRRARQRGRYGLCHRSWDITLGDQAGPASEAHPSGSSRRR